MSPSSWPVTTDSCALDSRSNASPCSGSTSRPTTGSPSASSWNSSRRLAASVRANASRPVDVVVRGPRPRQSTAVAQRLVRGGEPVAGGDVAVGAADQAACGPPVVQHPHRAVGAGVPEVGVADQAMGALEGDERGTVGAGERAHAGWYPQAPSRTRDVARSAEGRGRGTDYAGRGATADRPRRRLRGAVRPADRPPGARGAGLLRDRAAARMPSPRCSPASPRR